MWWWIESAGHRTHDAHLFAANSAEKGAVHDFFYSASLLKAESVNAGDLMGYLKFS